MNVSKNLSAIIAVIMVVSMVAVGATAVGAVGAQSAVEDTTLSTSEEVGVTGALTDNFRSSGAQSTPELDSQSAQVADQLEDASGETTVLLKVDRNIQLEESLPSEFSSEELEQDSEATLQPVVDSVNSLSNAEVTQRIVIGNALVVEIDLDQHDIDQLATIPGVEAVAPNIKFEHPAQLDESTGAVSPSDVTVPDPDAEYTWGLQQIGVPSFDEQFDVRGEGANVTIIDDGISDGDHPDLEFAQKVNIVDNEINVGAIGVTDNAHGEHVAGTATGALDPAGDVPRYGVAPNASLTKINVFEGTPGASFANILTAVDYAVTERNADVAGMSLSAGGPVSTVASIVDTQMREAKAAGTLVTVSAGNGGDFFQGGDEGAPVGTPSTEFDAFSVGASADQPVVINTTEAFPPSIPSSIAAFTGSNNDITQFSSGAIVSDRRSLDLLEGTVGVGDFYPDDYPRQYVQPDVAAPGLFVLSSGPLGNDAGAPGVNATSDGYSWTQGTSMAQPHVAGAVALIQSATEEDLGPQEISAALTETAEKPDNASEKFPSIGERDIRYGAGIINVTAAALAAQDMTEATGTVTDDAGEPVTGASLETEEGALVRTIDGEYSLASTESTPNVTVNAYGFDPVTEELTSDDQTFTLDRDLTVTEVVQGQPNITESGGEFTIVADVASVETFTLELSDSSSFQIGVDERDLTASIAGVGEIPFGEPVSLGNFTGLAEITVSISETADVATGDQLLLDHTFEGSGESVSVTTGPTTLVDAAGAVSSVSIDADFIGTINDQPTTTVTAEGILKDGEPSTGDRLTFTIGGEPVATAVSDGGVATAEVNAEALDLGPQEDVTVDVLEFEAAQTDTVDIVDEVADLEEGFNLLSVPQPATLTTQDVSSLNVWDSEDETYDTVTSPEFDTASDLHDGLYVDASSDNARLGFTFNEDVPVGGTQDVNTDWNLLGANFPLDSEDIGTSTTIENDLTGVDAAALELFRGDFSEFLTPNSQVGPFEAYWAFNPATSADERGIASPSYDEGDRRDVLGQGESDFQPTITNIETTSVEDADDEITLDDRDVVGASEQVVLVDVTVENNGDGTDVQFVTLEVAPQLGSGSGFELADQTGIELGPGESGDVTLAFVASQDDVSPLPPFFVPDDVAIEVTTEDGDAEDVGIPFDEGGITVEDQALSTDGEFVVENVDVAGHGTVQLVDANDNVLDSVEFAQGINEEVTFTVDDPANVTDDVTVRVLDDNELEELTSETVAVLDTRFTVSNNAPEFALVNETVDVPVTVTSNVAVPEDDVSVNFSVGGTEAGSQTVDLGAFGTETVSFPVDTTGLSVGDTVEHTATSPDDSDTRTLTIAEATLGFTDQSLNADGEVLVEDVTADEDQTIVVTDTDLNVVGEVDVADITTPGERGIDDEDVLVDVTGTSAGTHIAHVVADDFTVPGEGPGLVNQAANITVSTVDLADINNQTVSEAALPVEVVSSVTVNSEVVDAVGDRNSDYTVEIRQGSTVVGASDNLSDDRTGVTIELDDPVVVDEAQPEQTFTLTAVLVDQNGNEFDVSAGTNLDDDGFPVLTGNLDSAADEESFTVNVSGAENVNLPDQALGAANGSDAVLVNNVAADAGQFVVITPADDNNNVLGVTQFDETVSGGERIVEFDQEVGAGEFRAHITTDTGLLGDDGALVTDTGSVFNASVSITDQTFVGDTDELTVDSSNLQAEGPANYQIVVHDQTRANSSAVGPAPDDVGPALGFSDVLTGSESDVTIDLGQSITSTQDVLVMLHFTNPGASGPGGAIPVLNGSAFGFSDGQAGTITDTATVTIEPAPANYQLSNLDPETPVVSPGQTFDVSADVTNTGDLAGNQTIELRIDGDVDTQQAVEVGPGSSTTVTFENVSVGTVGEFTHTVASENDTVSGTLSVANERVTFDDQSLTADGEVLVTDVTTTTADQQVVITDSEFNVVGQTGDLGGVVVQENFLINVSTTPGEHIAHIVSNASEADGGPELVTDRATVVDAEVSVDNVSVSDTDDNTPVTVDEITVQTADVAAATQTDFTVEIEDDTGDVIGNATGLTGTNDNVIVSLDQPIEATSAGQVTEQITAVLVDENGSAFNIAQTQPADGLAQVSDDATVTIDINEAGASVTLNDQALGTTNGSDAVRTEDVTGEAGQFVVITPADSETILGSTELSQDVAGEQIDVELDQQISGGEFRAHLTTGTGLLGGDALVTDTGTVFEPASVTITDQTFVGGTSSITVDLSNLQADGPAEYRIVVHNQTGVPTGGVGPALGSSADISGSQDNVLVTLSESLTTTTDVLVMIHFPSSGSGTPIPVLNDDAFGISDGQAGTITDTATVTIEPAPANYQLSNLDPETPVVSPGQTFDVSADVTNTGDLAGNQTIELRIDGDVDTQQAVEVGPGSSTTVTFENVSVGTVGEFTHTVASENDTVSGTLSVANERVTFDDQSLTADGEVLVTDVTTTTADQQVVITDSEFNVVGQTGDLGGVVVQENFLINVSTTPGEHIAHIVSNASEADGGPELVTDRATVVDAEVSVDNVSVSDTDDNTPVTVDEITVQTADVAAATQTDFTVEIEDDTGDVIGNATGLTGTNDNVIVSLDQPIEATSVGEVTEDITAVLVDENGSAFQIADESSSSLSLTDVEDDATVTIDINEAGASVTLNDQALGTTNGSDAVRTEDVTGEAGQFVVITPADSETILGSTELSQDVAGEQIDVELDQQISGGEFRAHLTTGTGLLGGDALVTDTGTVFEPASVTITDQTFVGGTSSITVDSSNLQADGPAEYRIVVHDQTRANSGPAPSDVGPGIGSSVDLTGNESDVQINLGQSITSTQDVLVMIHFPDGGAAIPVLNGSAFGFGDGQAGTITDTATITSIESSQTFEDQVLTNNTADRGDSEVLVEDVRTNQSSDVLVTAGPDVTGTIVGIESVSANTSGQDLNISIDNRIGFPGAHTVHVVTGGVSNGEGVGDTVSNATERNITSNDTATVFDASVTITDQAFEDSTDQITVDSSDLQADGPAEYRIVVHDQTRANSGPAPDDVGPALGFSGVLNGSESDVTIDLGQSITSTQDVLVMIHFPNVGGSSPGAAIPVLNGPAFGFSDGQAGTVTDTATVTIEQAEGGNLEFNDQALGSNGDVVVENVQPVDAVEVTTDQAFDPQDDFLVLTEGTEVTGENDIIDFVQLSDVANGADVALNATGVSPGTHTVVLHEPNETGDAPDPTAPRTNASSGEVVNATATVFNGSVTVETDELNEEEEPLDEIVVDASLVGATEFNVTVTGAATGSVTGLSGDAGTVTVELDQELADGDTVTATIEQNGSAVQQATSAPGFQDLADDNTISVIAANFQLSSLTIDSQTPPANVDSGASPVDVGFTVNNTGDAAAEASLTLNVTADSSGDSVLTDARTTFELTPGDSLTTSFSDVDLGALDPAGYEVNVSTEDDTVTGGLTVEGTNFNVSGLDIDGQGDDATIREDEDFAVNATVDNLGNAQGTQDVVVNITNAAGNDVANASETITVTGGSSDTVNFTGLNVDVGITAEDFSVSVSSENTTATGDLRVEPLNVGVDIVDVDVNNNEIEIGDGPTQVDVTIENLADQELTRTVTVEVVDNETGPTGVTANVSQTLNSGDSLTTTLDLATSTLDQGNYTINATTNTDEDSVAFDVNFANVSNLDQTEGFDTLNAALGNLTDGDELRIGDVTLDSEPTDVTLSNSNVRIFGQGIGATTVQTNLTVTGDNNVIEALTLEGNFTDSGTNNTISGANVTSASPGGFVFVQATDATINNTAAENVVIDQGATVSIQQQSNVSQTLINNGTANISNSDVDSVTGTGTTTFENPSPGQGEVFVDDVSAGDTVAATFDSIQAANDAAAGDATLTLGSGTFNEEVTINTTGVTIEPAQGVTPTVSASGGTVFDVNTGSGNVTIDGVTIQANGNGTGVDASDANGLELSNNSFETDSSGTVYVTGESGLASDLDTVLGNNNFDPSAVVEAGEIVVSPTDVQIDSAEFDDGNSENDSVTILGSFLNTATELIGSIVVGFGNIAGNIGLGNVDVGNVEVGNQEFNVGNVDVGNNGELDISLDENIDLSDVDDDAAINITIDDIDTTGANVDDGNVSVDFEDTDGNSVAQNETNSSTAPSISIGT